MLPGTYQRIICEYTVMSDQTFLGAHLSQGGKVLGQEKWDFATYKTSPVISCNIIKGWNLNKKSNFESIQGFSDLGLHDEIELYPN